MLGDLFMEQWPELYTKRNSSPQINVIETDKKFKIEIAAPGMTKDDMRVELNNDNQLVVCLEKEVEKDANGKECCGDEDCAKDEKHHYLRREFCYTSFRQIFNLPESVDKDKITAKMSHGVLKIKLPKREGGEKQPEMKMIAIE
jgi:HSP20 family protein